MNATAPAPTPTPTPAPAPTTAAPENNDDTEANAVIKAELEALKKSLADAEAATAKELEQNADLKTQISAKVDEIKSLKEQHEAALKNMEANNKLAEINAQNQAKSNKKVAEIEAQTKVIEELKQQMDENKLLQQEL